MIKTNYIITAKNFMVLENANKHVLVLYDPVIKQKNTNVKMQKFLGDYPIGASWNVKATLKSKNKSGQAISKTMTTSLPLYE